MSYRPYVDPAEFAKDTGIFIKRPQGGMEVRTLWLRKPYEDKPGASLHAVTDIDTTGVRVNGKHITWKALLENYTTVDKVPCGVEEIE